MSKSSKAPLPVYAASCLIDGKKARVIATLDRRNKSVHLHLYREDSFNKRTPIRVSRIDKETVPEKDTTLIRHILAAALVIDKVEIKSIRRLIGEFETPESLPIRMIIRYR